MLPKLEACVGASKAASRSRTSSTGAAALAAARAVHRRRDRHQGRASVSESLDELREIDARYVMQTYKRAAGRVRARRGCDLYDGAGEEYLDFLAGISVCNAGHCHPHVVEAIREQPAA